MNTLWNENFRISSIATSNSCLRRLSSSLSLLIYPQTAGIKTCLFPVYLQSTYLFLSITFDIYYAFWNPTSAVCPEWAECAICWRERQTQEGIMRKAVAQTGRRRTGWSRWFRQKQWPTRNYLTKYCEESNNLNEENKKQTQQRNRRFFLTQKKNKDSLKYFSEE